MKSAMGMLELLRFVIFIIILNKLGSTKWAGIVFMGCPCVKTVNMKEMKAISECNIGNGFL